MPTLLMIAVARACRLQFREIELHADNEHEEDDPELADEMKRRHRRRREEKGLDVGKCAAEQRGAEEHAGEHLADDGSLAGTAEEPSDAAARRHDDEKLQQQDDDRGGCRTQFGSDERQRRHRRGFAVDCHCRTRGCEVPVHVCQCDCVAKGWRLHGTRDCPDLALRCTDRGASLRNGV